MLKDVYSWSHCKRRTRTQSRYNKQGQVQATRAKEGSSCLHDFSVIQNVGTSFSRCQPFFLPKYVLLSYKEKYTLYSRFFWIMFLMLPANLTRNKTGFILYAPDSPPLNNRVQKTSTSFEFHFYVNLKHLTKYARKYCTVLFGFRKSELQICA